jgi:hypothetical protein
MIRIVLLLFAVSLLPSGAFADPLMEVEGRWVSFSQIEIAKGEIAQAELDRRCLSNSVKLNVMSDNLTLVWRQADQPIIEGSISNVGVNTFKVSYPLRAGPAPTGVFSLVLNENGTMLQIPDSERVMIYEADPYGDLPAGRQVKSRFVVKDIPLWLRCSNQ